MFPSTLKKIAVHILILGIFVTPFFVHGASCSTGPTSNSGSVASVQLENPLKACTLYDFLLDIFTSFLNILVIVAIFYIIYSGFMMVTARGNEKQLSEARRSFMYAVIGTAVLLGATAIATLVQKTVEQVTK